MSGLRASADRVADITTFRTRNVSLATDRNGQASDGIMLICTSLLVNMEANDEPTSLAMLLPSPVFRTTSTFVVVYPFDVENVAWLIILLVTAAAPPPSSTHGAALSLQLTFALLIVLEQQCSAPPGSRSCTTTVATCCAAADTAADQPIGATRVGGDVGAGGLHTCNMIVKSTPNAKSGTCCQLSIGNENNALPRRKSRLSELRHERMDGLPSSRNIRGEPMRIIHTSSEKRCSP